MPHESSKRFFLWAHGASSPWKDRAGHDVHSLCQIGSGDLSAFPLTRRVDQSICGTIGTALNAIATLAHDLGLRRRFELGARVLAGFDREPPTDFFFGSPDPLAAADFLFAEPRFVAASF